MIPVMAGSETAGSGHFSSFIMLVVGVGVLTILSCSE